MPLEFICLLHVVFRAYCCTDIMASCSAAFLASCYTFYFCFSLCSYFDFCFWNRHNIQAWYILVQRYIPRTSHLIHGVPHDNEPPMYSQHFKSFMTARSYSQNIVLKSLICFRYKCQSMYMICMLSCYGTERIRVPCDLVIEFHKKLWNVLETIHSW